jgi:hypothetical protein
MRNGKRDITTKNYSTCFAGMPLFSSTAAVFQLAGWRVPWLFPGTQLPFEIDVPACKIPPVLHKAGDTT